MTIPTLVIGVGGTGLKVLLRVKERFLEAYDTLPDNVTLLEIDTDVYEGEDFNQVSLVPNEFFHVATERSDQRMDTIYERKQNGDPEWQWVNNRWLQQELWWKEQNIGRPAGTDRPAGRVALFLRYRDVYTKILNSVTKTTQQYDNTTITPDEQFSEIPKANIFVVASVAGGSGAGMMLDILRMLQHMRKKGILKKSKIYVNALLVGGAAFGEDVEARTHSNTMAALRELERLGAVADKRLNAAVPPIMELPQPLGRFEGTVTPADSIFLFDRPDRIGRSDRVAGSRNAAQSFLEFVIAPTLADMILAFADEKINTKINTVTEDLNSNLKSKDPYNRGKVGYYPYLSAGTSTFIFPERDVRRSAGFRLLGEFWRTYLVHDNDSRDVPSISANLWGQELDQKTPTVNPEIFVKNGLSKSLIGNSIVNKQFIQILVFSANTGELTIPEGKAWWQFWRSPSMIQRVLNLVGYPQSENISEGEITRSIDRLESNIDSSIKRELDRCRSVADVREWRRQYLGEGVASDENTPQGEWLKWLQEQSHFDDHANEFRQVLQQLIIAILNDRTPDNRIIPYRLEYSLQVLKHLEQKILKVMGNPANTGEVTLGLVDDYFHAQEAKVTKKYQRMVAYEDGETEPQDFDAYLDVIRQYAEARKETVGKELLVALCDILLKQVEEIQTVLEDWQSQLKNIGTKLGEIQSAHDTWRKTKNKIPVRTYVTDEAFESQLYAKHQEAALENLATAMQWQVKAGGMTFTAPFTTHIGLDVSPKVVAKEAIAWAGTKKGPFKRLGDEPEVKLATRVKEHLNANYQSLADQLVKDINIAALVPVKSFPTNRLYHVLGLHQTVANDTVVSKYYQNVQKKVSNQLKAKNYYRIGAGYISDPENHRHTVAMEIAVGFKLDHRTDYEGYIETYRKDTNNDYALHCLAEEDTASIEYEIEFYPTNSLYPGLNVTPLLLDPTIVDILGDSERLSLFVNALTFGVIRRRDEETRRTDHIRGADYYLHLANTVGNSQTIRLSKMTTEPELKQFAKDFSPDWQGLNTVIQDETLVNRIRLMFALRTFILYEKEIDDENVLIDYQIVEGEVAQIINGYDLDTRVEAYNRQKDNFLELYQDCNGQYDSLAHLGLVLTKVADGLLQAEYNEKGGDNESKELGLGTL